MRKAVFSYFQVENIGAIKKLEVNNTILHEMFTDQINMMHNGRWKPEKFSNSIILIKKL
jgi:hypothetical protein